MEKTYSDDLHGTSNAANPSYAPSRWLWLYKQDIARYKSHRPEASLLNLLCTEQGLWVLFHHRVASAIYRSSLPEGTKQPLIRLTIIWQKFLEIITGIAIGHQAIIGPGFYIGHFSNIFVSGDAIIGHTCNISQGVTIGVSGRGPKRGTPQIGNRVYIATNAVVVGKSIVGDDAVIGANSLVTTDVAPHTTVIGVPAQFRNSHGSEEYLDPQ